MEAAFETTFNIFGEKNAFRKWDGNEQEYERRFNRAIYDVMMFYFAQPKVRRAIKTKGKEIEADFRKICEQNQMFVRAIETTTKSMEATVARLSIWGEALSRKLKMHLDIPTIVDHEITLI